MLVDLIVTYDGFGSFMGRKGGEVKKKAQCGYWAELIGMNGMRALNDKKHKQGNNCIALAYLKSIARIKLTFRNIL